MLNVISNLKPQALTESKDVAPYICGVVMADGPLFPGQTWRGQLDVDDDVCHDPVYSVVSMLSESCLYT